MPTSVARVGSNLPNGNFIPEIWHRMMQDKFYPNSVLDEIVNRKYEGSISGQGSKVYIRQRPTVVVNDYDVNSELSYQDLQDDKLELVIDKSISYAFKMDDIDKAQADINIVQETTADAAQQMATKIDRDVLGSTYVDATTALSSTAATATNVLGWIVDAMTALDEKNVPIDGRFVVVPPWVLGNIMKSDLKDASIAGDSTSILRNGKVGTIGNATLYMSNNLATDGTTWNCIAGTKHAISFASQLVKTENIRLQNTFGEAIRGLRVYGYKVVVPDALVHMPATKS
ncbi:MAG: hypothetical protein HQL47_06125 [Gammaproteobacteria bacterium]|nr:hypothetical protein [Gammaproteobacteria bacterium]